MSKSMDKLMVNKIIASSFRAHVPAEVRRIAPPPMVVYKNGDRARELFTTHAQANRAGSGLYPCALPRFKPFVDEKLGHLCTSSVELEDGRSWVQTPGLRRAFSNETSFRATGASCWLDSPLEEYVDGALAEYAERMSREHGVRSSVYDRCVRAVVNAIKDRTAALRNYNAESVLALNTHDKAERRWLKGRVVVSIVDKNAGRFAFMCASWYHENCQAALGNTSAYEAYTTEDYDALLERLNCFAVDAKVVKVVKYQPPVGTGGATSGGTNLALNTESKLPEPPTNLSTFYMTAKFHLRRRQSSARFVADAASP